MVLYYVRPSKLTQSPLFSFPFISIICILILSYVEYQVILIIFEAFQKLI